MRRHARLNAEGALHHIIVRGIERRLIFRDDIDRDRFVERMGQVFSNTHTTCYAWALLGNHAHLVLKTGIAPLHTVMSRLLTGDAVAFNRRHRRYGQLFQNRYKSVLCQEDAYLTELVCYVHLNPLRAGLVKELSALSRYPYSGHAGLVGKAHPWQDVGYVLAHFASSPNTARQCYLSFMESRIARGKRPDLTGGGLLRSYGSWAEVKSGSRIERVKGDEGILGDSAFVQRVLSSERLSVRPEGLTLDAIAERVAGLCDLSIDALRNRSRKAHLVEARSLFCFWVVRQGRFPAAQVAAFLHMTPPGVGYAVKWREAIAREKGHTF